MLPTGVPLLLAACLALPAGAQAPEDPPVASSATAATPAPNPVIENRAAEAPRAHFLVADLVKAADSFETAVKLSSRSAELVFDAAIALEEAGRPERALVLYQRAAELARDAEKEAA